MSSTILPPDDTNGPRFNPWNKKYRDKVQLIPVPIKTATGNFSLDLPTYYAGYFDYFDEFSFHNLKIELRERLENINRGMHQNVFGQAYYEGEIVDVGENDPIGNLILFTVLEDFSSLDLEISEDEKKLLKKEILGIMFLNEFQGPNSDIYKADSYFALFCKILAVEEKVNLLHPDTPGLDEHKELVDGIISNYIGSMELANKFSEICVLPRNHFEELIRNDFPKPIRNRLWQLLQPNEWDRRASVFRENIAGTRNEILEQADSHRIAQNAKELHQLEEKFSTLQSMIEPNSKSKREIWESPFESICTSFKNKKNIVYVTGEPFRGGLIEIGNQSGSKIADLQIKFLEEIAKQGFKDWVLTGSFIDSFSSISEYLRNSVNAKSAYEIKECVGKFLSLDSNKLITNIRGFLPIERREDEPNVITVAINYINEIRRIVEENKINVTLFECSNDDNKIFCTFLLGENKKRLFFGAHIDIEFEDALYILHSNSYKDRFDDFHILSGIPYVSKILAERHGYGWGKDGSISVQIEGNKDLLSLENLEIIPEGQEASTKICSDSDRRFNFLIVTDESAKDDDGDVLNEIYDPNPGVRNDSPLILK